MRRQSLIVLVWLTVASAAGAQQLLPWTMQEIEAAWTQDHGQWIDVAIEPATERPEVSAMLLATTSPMTESVVWYRYFGGAGWSDTDWRAFGTGYVSGERFGEHLSMDAYSSPSFWKLGFAFRDRTNGALTYLEHWGTGSSNGTLVRQEILSSLLTSYGLYASLRIDTGGLPHIASHGSSVIGDDSLIYSRYVGSGGNCGVDTAAGQWQCETITTGPLRGKYSALALDDADLPLIMFSDNSSGVGTLWFAKRLQSIGNCGVGNAAGNWECSEVETFPSSEVVETAVHYNAGVLHIVHLAVAGDQATLRYATASQNATLWGWSTIAQYTDYTPGGRTVDVTTDGDGQPVILYRQADVNQVRIARPTQAGPLHGNCGPSLTWQCDVIDPGSTLGAVGEWVSIASDKQGRLFAGFSRYDSTAGRHRLWVAYPWLFKDGFEGGSTEWWASTVAAR